MKGEVAAPILRPLFPFDLGRLRSLSLTPAFHTDRSKWQRDRYRRRYNGELPRVPFVFVPRTREMKFGISPIDRRDCRRRGRARSCVAFRRQETDNSRLSASGVEYRRRRARQDYTSAAFAQQISRDEWIVSAIFLVLYSTHRYILSVSFLHFIIRMLRTLNRTFLSNKTQRNYLPSEKLSYKLSREPDSGNYDWERIREQLSASKS